MKEELLGRQKLLEEDSRGWFEEDAELEARLKEVRWVETGSSRFQLHPGNGPWLRPRASRAGVSG